MLPETKGSGSILGDGDEVGPMADVNESVIQVLIVSLDRVELAVINPNIGACLAPVLAMHSLTFSILTYSDL